MINEVEIIFHWFSFLKALNTDKILNYDFQNNLIKWLPDLKLTTS